MGRLELRILQARAAGDGASSTFYRGADDDDRSLLETLTGVERLRSNIYDEVPKARGLETGFGWRGSSSFLHGSWPRSTHR
jgi:hypothetical protein